MSISLGGRSIRGLRYVDELGDEHVIILAYLDGVAVWDGRMPVFVQAPRAMATAVGYAPVVSAESRLVAPAAVAYAEAGRPVIAGAVSIAPPAAVASAVVQVPELSHGHVIDIPAAIASAEAHVPVVSVVAGIIAPTAVATAVGHVPDVSAAVTAGVPVALVYAEAHVPEVGSRVELVVPTASASAAASAPTVSAAVAVAVPVASASAAGYAPTLSRGHNLSTPTAAASATAYAPEVQQANPEYVDAISDGGSFPSNYTKTIQTGRNGAVVVAVHVNSDSITASVSVGGVAATLIDSTTRWWVFAVTGLPEGAASVVVSWSVPGGNFSGNFAAMSFSDVTAISTPQITTSATITLTGTGRLAAGLWAATGNRNATQGDVLRVKSPQINDNVIIHGTTSTDAVMGLTSPQRGACFWLT
ncbi:hypothetical protein [Gordonia sp. SND2]|uniref:hypothetical protein n=1 Tax=Gordonia sp. SND2 TaxID=3388659 RepID=UPI00398AB7B1